MSSTTEIRFIVRYRVPRQIIYNILTTERDISCFTQSPSKFEKKVGGEFSMYNGAISGTVDKLDEQNTKLSLNWKFSNWPRPALVNFNIKEKEGNECQITVLIKNCPERDTFNQTIDFDNVKSGFKTQIFDNIEKFCGLPMNRDNESSDED